MGRYTFFRKVRNALGLSQDAVAPLVGRSATQARNYDRGGADPPPEVWEALEAEARRRNLPIADEIRAVAAIAPPAPSAVRAQQPSEPIEDSGPLAGVLTDHERSEIARLTGEIAEKLQKIQEISAGKKS